jgi:hypothetical protein
MIVRVRCRPRMSTSPAIGTAILPPATMIRR